MKYRFHLLLLLFILFSLPLPASAHSLDMAGSKWLFGRDYMVASMEWGPSLMAALKGAEKEKDPQQIAAKVLQPYVAKKLAVTVNDRAYPVKVDRLEQKPDGSCTIWLSARHLSFNGGDNQLKINYSLFFEETGDQHVNVAYLYFSKGPAERANEVFERQEPAARQIFDVNTPVFETVVTASAKESSTAAQAWGNVWKFLALGVKHIFSGYDHIAFLLALIVIGLPLKEVLKIITAFTVAHSITLLLAALQVVTLNSRFVESVIALSICYVAVENLAKREVRNRWLITFGFGLIHGFGFASVLQELIVERSNLVSSVLSFNLGVELGQLMIFFVMLPVLYLLTRSFPLRKVTTCTSIAIFLIAFTWLIERTMDVKVLAF